jgi:hypothetical protein
MPVWFAPLVFQGLVAAARAAVPHVARMLTTQASYVSARTTLASAAARTTVTNIAKNPAAYIVPAAVGATALGVTANNTSNALKILSNQSGSQSFGNQNGFYPDQQYSPTGTGPGPTSPTSDRAANSTSQSQPAPEPPPPPELGPPPVYAGVKAAPIDTVVFVDEPFDPNYFEDVLFQDFGGQELLTVARNDTVNGQNISYQPFKDLGIIRDQYTPNSLLSIQETSDRFFANFLIRLNEKIPGVGNGPDGATVYLEDEGETGSIVIEFINIESNEQVEIQILNAGIIEDIGI